MLFLEEAESTTTTQYVKNVDSFFQFDFGDSIPQNVQVLLNKCIEVVVVFIILLILCKVVDGITKCIKKKMLKKNVDKTATKALYSLLNKGLKIILVLIAVGCIGIDTTSIIGLFTAAGLGIGLAIQGALSNFAGGILILVLRPFRVDDYIECQGVSGTVEDIKIFYTYLVTPDNKVVMVPNGSLVGGNVINYSSKATRRVDLTFNIDYEENFLDAKKVIEDVIKAHALILKDPEWTIRIASLNESSISISVRVWVNNGDYWTVYFELLEQAYSALKVAGIKIPYNQLEISYREALEKSKECANR